MPGALVSVIKLLLELKIYPTEQEAVDAINQGLIRINKIPLNQSPNFTTAYNLNILRPQTIEIGTKTRKNNYWIDKSYQI